MSAAESGSFRSRLGEIATEARALRARAAEAPEEVVAAEAIEDLANALEELRVAQEQIHAQSDQLASSRLEAAEAEARYEDLFNLAPDGYLVTDAAGIIRKANAAAGRLLNYRAAWLPGRPLSVFVPRSVVMEFRRQVNLFNREPGRKRLELPMQRRGGAMFPAEVSVQPVTDRHGVVASLWWIVRDITERRRMEAQLVEIASVERERIGGDLHDGLSYFAAVSMQIQALRRKLEREAPHLVANATQVYTTLQEGITEARRLSHALCPAFIKHGDLREALEHVARTIRPVPGMTVDVACPRPVPTLTTSQIEQLYRIAQEAANNALRHGRATRIELAVEHTRRELVLRIRDNGSGLPEHLDAAQAGIGVSLMRHRATLLGGSLEIGPGDTGGVAVACHVPLAPRPVVCATPTAAERSDART